MSVGHAIKGEVCECKQPRLKLCDAVFTTSRVIIRFTAFLLFFPELLRFPYILVPPLSKDVRVHKISSQYFSTLSKPEKYSGF